MPKKKNEKIKNDCKWFKAAYPILNLLQRSIQAFQLADGRLLGGDEAGVAHDLLEPIGYAGRLQGQRQHDGRHVHLRKTEMRPLHDGLKQHGHLDLVELLLGHAHSLAAQAAHVLQCHVDGDGQCEPERQNVPNGRDKVAESNEAII